MKLEILKTFIFKGKVVFPGGDPIETDEAHARHLKSKKYAKDYEPAKTAGDEKPKQAAKAKAQPADKQ